MGFPVLQTVNYRFGSHLSVQTNEMMRALFGIIASSVWSSLQAFMHTRDVDLIVLFIGLNESSYFIMLKQCS